MISFRSDHIWTCFDITEEWICLTPTLSHCSVREKQQKVSERNSIIWKQHTQFCTDATHSPFVFIFFLFCFFFPQVQKFWVNKTVRRASYTLHRSPGWQRMKNGQEVVESSEASFYYRHIFSIHKDSISWPGLVSHWNLSAIHTHWKYHVPWLVCRHGFVGTRHDTVWVGYLRSHSGAGLMLSLGLGDGKENSAVKEELWGTLPLFLLQLW